MEEKARFARFAAQLFSQSVNMINRDGLKIKQDPTKLGINYK